MTALNAAFWTALHFRDLFGPGAAKKLFNPMLRFFREKPFERSLYQKIRLPKWKDRLPEGGSVVGFSKKSLQSCRDPGYIDQFITETCVGELVHLSVAVFGYLSLLFALIFEKTPISPTYSSSFRRSTCAYSCFSS